MFYFKHLALSPWAERKHARLEKMVLDDASVVVAVSPLVQDEFKAMTTTEVELITNGFDEDDFAVKPQRDEYFSITHTGLFASDGNPDILSLLKNAGLTANSKNCSASGLQERPTSKSQNR